MANKTREELEQELKFLKRHHFGDNIASVVNNAVRWIGLLGISYFTYRAIEVLAGRETSASFGFKFLSEFKITYGLAVAVSAGAVFYGVRQRNLRRTVTARLTTRIRLLELRIDPKRSSSDLLSSNDTPDERPT